jgi:hypothetical protein
MLGCQGSPARQQAKGITTVTWGEEMHRNLHKYLQSAASIASAFTVSLFLAATPSAAQQTPNMATLTPVPATPQLPLSSAHRVGTEYSDLAAAGYVEEEYYLSGIAPAITAAGENLLDAPYITRILVRKPANPAKFNGTVIIEPFSWFGERGAGWILTRDYLLRQGYAYVGYTLNINQPAQDPKFPPLPDVEADDATDPASLYRPVVNFEFMRRFDYARYANLATYYDPTRFQRGDAPDPFVPQSQAIGAQLALMLKSNLAGGPMRGLDVARVYVNSWAVTAQVWMDYLDQGRHQQWRMPDGSPLIDAYMTGRMIFGEVGGEMIHVPRNMPSDAPFVTIYTQSEAMYEAMANRPLPADSDHPKLRYYEVMGTPHLRLADHGTEHREHLAADVGKGDDPKCQTLYDEPAEYIFSALLDGMDQWVRFGKAMPKAARAKRAGAAIARDQKGQNMIGGVRPPWIIVPSASYMTEQETQCGLIYDTKLPYSATKLRNLYGNYDNYQKQFEAAKIKAIQQGMLLPEDAAKLAPMATPQDFHPAK